jgi:tetratricopeptide (TPR) repeat protein
MLLLAPLLVQETPLQAAVRLSGAGRHAEALRAAAESQAPLERAQGELYSYHRAGALEEALGAGLRALDAAPDDPWTLEETAYVALSLGEASLAASLLERLAAGQTPEERMRTAWMAEEAARALELRGAERRALERARLVVLSGTGLALVLLVAGAMGGRGAGTAHG